MLVVSGDGKIDAAGQTLLNRIAEKLHLPPSDVEHLIEECRVAAARGDLPQVSSSHITDRDSRRMSRRIFKRIVGNAENRKELLEQYDNARGSDRQKLEMNVLEKLAQAPQNAVDSGDLIAAREKRQRLTYLEDGLVIGRLRKEDKVSDLQVREFRKQQEKAFQTDGKLLSAVTEMVKSGALNAREVWRMRERFRRENAELVEKSVTRRRGNFEALAQFITLDQTFLATYIRLKGSLDHDIAPMLQRLLDDVFDRRDDTGRLLIFNLRDVGYTSSTGVNVIVAAHQKCLERWGGTRFIAPISDALRGAFKIAGADKILTEAADVPEALWSFTDLAQMQE
jgi:anti-anti-sigma factor